MLFSFYFNVESVRVRETHTDFSTGLLLLPRAVYPIAFVLNSFKHPRNEIPRHRFYSFILAPPRASRQPRHCDRGVGVHRRGHLQPLHGHPRPDARAHAVHTGLVRVRVRGRVGVG